MLLNVMCNRRLISLENTTNRTSSHLSYRTSTCTSTLSMSPIRLLQRSEQAQLPRPPPTPLIIQILIFIPNIPLHPSPSHPTTTTLPIPPQPSPDPTNKRLSPYPLGLGNKPLHPTHPPIPQPYLDAPRMIATCKQISDYTLDLVARGLVLLEDYGHGGAGGDG
ncbi:DUF2196 domain containing protein [Pyrenophora teres f. maculata]|nr:DUF2196 domain containing protein [Pyrenophora teres f. maculata]